MCICRCGCAGVRRAEAAAAIAPALAQVGWRISPGARPKALSGGHEHARLHRPRSGLRAACVLLMDEPFAALDEFTRHRLQEDLHALWRHSGKTIVFVTHSIYEAAFLASRILVMSPRPGRIAADIRTAIPEGADRRSSAGYVALVAADDRDLPPGDARDE